MAAANNSVGTYVNKTATGNILPRDGQLLGFYVNSTSSGTVILYDSATTTTTTVISGTITPAIGWNPYPVQLINGLYAVIANTLNVTFVVA